MVILFCAKVLRSLVLDARKFALSIFFYFENGELRASAQFERASCFPGHPGAFSLLLCIGECSEVRLFLRKSRAGIGCFVYTRSENAVVRSLFSS